MSGNQKVTGILMMLGLSILPFVSGCGTAGSAGLRTHFESFTPDELNKIQADGSHQYQIQADDVLMVTFAYLDNLTQDRVIVLSDGSVNLIGVGRLELAGLDVTAADSVVTAAYSREYREPDVSIVVRESVGRKVYVMGQVQQPGLYSLPPGGADAYAAIAIAGGFTPDAAKGGSVLVRVSGAGYLVQELDLSGVDHVDSLQLGLVRLQSYDLVYVPRSRIGDFGYFSRSVLNGLVSLTRIASDIRYLSGIGYQRF